MSLRASCLAFNRCNLGWGNTRLRSLDNHRSQIQSTICNKSFSASSIAKMRAYWFDNKEGDQRLAHDSGREVDAAYLEKLGIIHHNFPSVSDVDALAAARGYKNRDQITISPTTMGDVYEEKVKTFFNEHLHEDEEIRYIIDGGGFFDVRSEGDDWVRIKLDKHDLMIMPAGIYHRFTTDEKNYTVAMRLFQDDPKWTPLSRADATTDSNQFRQQYLQNYAKAQ